MKPVTKYRVYEKIISRSAPQVNPGLLWSSCMSCPWSQNPAARLWPKMQTGCEFARDIVQMASFRTPVFYVWVFLDQLRKDTVFSS